MDAESAESYGTVHDIIIQLMVERKAAAHGRDRHCRSRRTVRVDTKNCVIEMGTAMETYLPVGASALLFPGPLSARLFHGAYAQVLSMIILYFSNATPVNKH